MVCVVDAGATTVAHTSGVGECAAVLLIRRCLPDRRFFLTRCRDRPSGVARSLFGPGVVLAREVRARLAAHAREWGMPRVIYLQNHGLVVLGSSAGQALQLTEMADKVSRVVAAALALGNVVPMTDESAERIDTRDDEQIRRTAWHAPRCSSRQRGEADVRRAAVLDLLIDREHDEVADVDVTRQCQHVQDGIGHPPTSARFRQRHRRRRPRRQ